MPSRRPIIGITVDVSETVGRARAHVALAYATRVVSAGGDPVFLVPVVELIPEQIAMIDGVVLTGGGDPRMEEFGEGTHPEAKVMHEQRQAYEVALVRALGGKKAGAGGRDDVPTLGICLGMQLMSLGAGGRLDQHLPDTYGSAAAHGSGEHPMALGAAAAGTLLGARGEVRGKVASHHHQGVCDAGRLEVLARSEDGIIEAVRDPSRAFYVGVQWHPERTDDADLGQGVFDRFVQSCGARAASDSRPC